MWMTGFDAPSVSTIYLDKPMRNHSLMQTIARANRVFGDKVNGLIVDYIGVFRNIQEALAIYGSASGGGVGEDDTPVKDKLALIEQLRGAIAETLAFCSSKGIQLSKLESTQDVLQRTKLWNDAVEAILVNDEAKRTFFSLVGYVTRLYKAILPDTAANEFASIQFLLARLVEKVRIETGTDSDVSDLMEQVGALLDESITTEAFIAGSSGTAARAKESAGQYVIHESPLINLSQIDFEALQAKFSTGYKRTEAEKLKGQITQKLQQMVRLNRTRIDYLEKFQQMIEAYNADSRNIEAHFRELIQFAQSLATEDKRAIAENLTEEELAIFDLLTKPKITLSKQEQQTIKQIAKELLAILKREKLVLDWRKRPQTKAGVEVAIKDCLDQLPESYTAELYEQKCRDVYQHIYESYYGQERSIYDSAG
jgi:type I restriction enzyme R subunit